MSTDDVDIAKLATLARLELTPAEQASFGPQVSAILDFVDQLSALDTTDIEPMTTALDVENYFRPDKPQPSLRSDVATREAPESEDGFFLVPPVLG